MTILPTPSAATPPRSGQPGTGIAPPRSCQAAPIPRPATPGGFDGKPSIPSEDDGGAKMDDASRSGRAPLGAHKDTQSSHAVTLPHPCVNSLPRAATGVDGSEPSALSFDEDGPRIVWAPLAIIAVSFALWAGFWLSVKWAWEVFL